MKVERNNIYVTETDLQRLERLVAMSAKDRNVLNLEEELGRAIIVSSEEIGSNVVTMNSKVRFRDETTGEESVVTLVYPVDSNVNEGKVSVLAPIGTALLGLSVNDTIDWPMPNGKSRVLTIMSVIYQPESDGNHVR